MFVGFLGTHERSLDEKGRLALPVPFRSHLGDTCFIGKVQGTPCLAVWTTEEFNETLERLRAKVRTGEATQNQLRRFAASASEVRQDNQGRIMIPASLRESVGLDREAVVTGAIDRVEVWTPERWTQVEGLETEEDADSGGEWL